MGKYIHYFVTGLALVLAILALAKTNDALAIYSSVKNIQSTVGALEEQKQALEQGIEKHKSSLEDLSSRFLGTAEVNQTDLHMVHKELEDLKNQTKRLQAEVRQIRAKVCTKKDCR